MAPRALLTQRSPRQSVPAAVLPEPEWAPSNKTARGPARTTAADSSSTAKSNSVQWQNGPIPIRAPQKPARRTTGSAPHNPDSMSPSVAALLAMTTIPPLRRGSARSLSKRKSPPAHPGDDELILSGSDDGFFVGMDTPLDMLLGPLDEALPMERHASVVSVRSDSSDSVPSLSGDNESVLSLTLPPTPGSRRPSMAKKSRLSSEDCAADHPLLSSPADQSLDGAFSNITTRPNLPSSRTTSLKSNLTASLRAIKAAAMTLSTFGAPAIPPDDLLHRSIITPSPRLTDDRIPPALSSTPSPQVRRYFNPPPTHTLSGPAALFYTPHSDFPYTVSIQMQEYIRRPIRRPLTRRASTTPSDPLSLGDPPLEVRQQGLRSNSDFVRVWCLVLAMHRAGKFTEAALLKPQRGLPMRAQMRSVEQRLDGPERKRERIPRRWRGVSINAEPERVKVMVRKRAEKEGKR